MNENTLKVQSKPIAASYGDHPIFPERLAYNPTSNPIWARCNTYFKCKKFKLAHTIDESEDAGTKDKAVIASNHIVVCQ